MAKFVEIPDNMVIEIPIMRGEDCVGVKRIDLGFLQEAEVAPIVHGKWIRVPLNMDPRSHCYRHNLRKKCSACLYAMPNEYPDFNICPCCGAKMDGGKDGT